MERLFTKVWAGLRRSLSLSLSLCMCMCISGTSNQEAINSSKLVEGTRVQTLTFAKPEVTRTRKGTMQVQVEKCNLCLNFSQAGRRKGNKYAIFPSTVQSPVNCTSTG